MRRREPELTQSGDAAARLGMTLIEMLIAIALTLALMSSMFVFYFNMLSSRSKAIEHMRQQQAATTLINWLDSDLATCIAGDPVIGAGVKGDSVSLRLFTRGMATSVAQHGSDDPEVFSDLQLAEYRFNALEQRIEGRRLPSLTTRSGSSTTGTSAASEFSPLDGRIYRVRFRYFHRDAWHDSFDSLQSNGLPSAVEIAIWLNPIDSDDLQRDEWPQTQGDDDGPEDVSITDVEESFQPEVKSTDDPPPPDRVRIVLIPDAHDSASSSTETFARVP